MPDTAGSKWPEVVIVAALALAAPGTCASEVLLPTNALPNPYRTIAPWGDLPAGRVWGALSAVAIDRDGK